MEFKQYINKRNKPVFMYIHGECLSTFSFKIETKELKKDFTVISTTNNGAVVSRLSNVPFAHKMRISRDGASDCDGVIMLGKDFK